MDRSIRGSPDPVAGALNGERRRCIRQKLHTPVYASFNGPQTGMVVDLSELLDLHEEGFAVQTSEPLEMNRAVTLCLDLPETRSFIHGSGQVIWSDAAGRGGIRFSALPESSQKILKEWLFANLLIACSNHAARTEQLARHEEEKSPGPAPIHPSAVCEPTVSEPTVNELTINEPANVVPIFDGSGLLDSVEEVRQEIGKIANDVDAVFQLITERALSLTGASGAALAFLTQTSLANDKMICRAQAGNQAPPLGAPVDIKQGLSGECVRSGLLVSCEDMGNDPRVDPKIGRALGIGSLMAAPIVSDFRVVGLLEVFSPHPRSFTKTHGTVLERLVEIIPKTDSEKTQPGKTQTENTRSEMPIESESVLSSSDFLGNTGPAPSRETMEPRAVGVGVVEVSSDNISSANITSMHAIRDALWEQRPEVSQQVTQQEPEPIVAEHVPEPVPEPAPAVPSRLLDFGLLGLAILVVAIVAGYVVSPMIEKRWAGSPQTSQQHPGAETVSGQSLTGHIAHVKSLEELRELADHGDADAQWQMGVRYHNGEDVPHDDTQAVQWFQRAAEQGNVAAQGALGAYYFAAHGVPQDLSKAYFWSEIALAQGDELSKGRLELLASQMTRAQVSAAIQQAELWMSQHNAAKSTR